MVDTEAGTATLNSDPAQNFVANTVTVVRSGEPDITIVITGGNIEVTAFGSAEVYYSSSNSILPP